MKGAGMYCDTLSIKRAAITLAITLSIVGCSVTESNSGSDSASIYLDRPRQIIRGFGAANIVGWRPDMTADEVQLAFGTGSGQLGFTILRLRVPPDSTQFGINIPSAKLAYSMGATIIATPWTPPAWMKTNNSIVGGSLDTNNYSAFAAHLKAFADTMSNSGAPLYAISVQNEPDANVSYESCFWNGAQFHSFMKNNAASVGMPVFMPESMNFNHSLSDASLNDPAAAANIAFIGGHIYGRAPSSYPLATGLGKEVWMTEYLVLDTTWAAVLGTAKNINDCMNAQMSAYVWWYIVRYYGPIDESGIITRRGYVMSQFARFVRPGFHKVDATQNPRPNVFLTAYKNGSSVVVVALNMDTSSVNQAFKILNATFTSFTPFTTSSSKNCVQGSSVPFSSGSFTATLEGSSVTTFVSN
jgi:glucuronoarabinoxylan endo-1,4-beta-xylanase